MQDICLLSPRASARNGTMRRMMEFGGYFRCNLCHEQVTDNVRLVEPLNTTRHYDAFPFHCQRPSANIPTTSIAFRSRTHLRGFNPLPSLLTVTVLTTPLHTPSLASLPHLAELPNSKSVRPRINPNLPDAYDRSTHLLEIMVSRSRSH